MPARQMHKVPPPPSHSKTLCLNPITQKKGIPLRARSQKKKKYIVREHCVALYRNSQYGRGGCPQKVLQFFFFVNSFLPFSKSPPPPFLRTRRRTSTHATESLHVKNREKSRGGLSFFFFYIFLSSSRLNCSPLFLLPFPAGSLFLFGLGKGTPPPFPLPQVRLVSLLIQRKAKWFLCVCVCVAILREDGDHVC